MIPPRRAPITFRLAGAFAWAVSACAAPPPRAQETDSLRVREVAEGILEADNARDLERVLGYYAPDAMLLPPGEGPVRGRDRIRPRYEALFGGFVPEIEGMIEELVVDGDLAYVRGRNGGRMRSLDGSDERELHDAYLMVLRRATDGRWRITRLMWHPDRPPSEQGGGER